MPPIHCSRLSLKTQARGADDARWMDISEGRSEDSAGMAHGSNTRLQWPRAAAARALECLTNECCSSVFGLVKEALGEEEARSGMREALLGWPAVTCWRDCRRGSALVGTPRDDLDKAFTGLLLQLRPSINPFIRFLIFNVSNIQGRPGERPLSL